MCGRYSWTRWSKAFIASIHPIPTSPTTFSCGTTTFSNVTERVSEALYSCCALTTNRDPSQSRSTINRHPFVPSRLVSISNHKIPICDTSIGNPHFVAIQNPFVAITNSCRLRLDNIRTRTSYCICSHDGSTILQVCNLRRQILFNQESIATNQYGCLCESIGFIAVPIPEHPHANSSAIRIPST